MHADHELITVKIDVQAIHQSIALIEAGIRQGQNGWIDLAVEQIKAQVDRAVRLGHK